MKIKGWEKINGFTYKGYTIVNPTQNVGETKYMADVLNLNLPQKPKCQLSILTNDDIFHTGSSEFSIELWDSGNDTHTRISANKQLISSISGFRTIFENLVDELILLNNTNSNIVTPISHSFSVNGITQLTGNTSVYTPSQLSTISTNNINLGIDYTELISKLIDAIKENDELLEQLQDFTLELQKLR